jgi:hypothetical protein
MTIIDDCAVLLSQQPVEIIPRRLARLTPSLICASPRELGTQPMEVRDLSRIYRCVPECRPAALHLPGCIWVLPFSLQRE